MMAYNDQFVLCVLRDGRPVREIGGGINLPFDSEYKVRLKNKHPFLRAKAKVWIDGRQVSNLGDFILGAGETLDLERFLDESMSSGRRFKFVPLGDGRVNDPTDPENGIIKVEFHREIQPSPYPNPRPFVKSAGPRFGSSGFTYDVNPTYGSIGSTLGSNSVRCSSSYTVSETHDSAGATVEGGHSGQGFVYGSDFLTETRPITLELRVRGLDQRSVNWEDKPTRQPKRRIKFCPSCGSKRHGMSKFCSGCGTAYHPRYERERGSVVK